MGVVWKAIDLIQEAGDARDSHVAIKFLSRDFKQHPDALKALVREFNRYRRLSHPNIVKAHGLDRLGNTYFMVMELLKGIPLNEFIKTRPNGLSLTEAEPIIKGMAQALAYAHQEGLAHLDFKPANVFYDPEAKSAKVIDFGIARPLEQSERDETLFDPGALGALTDAYASYEMLLGLDPDQRDDIYGLACVTYELLSGKHPFKRKKATRAKDEKLSPKHLPGLKRQQNKALLRGLAFHRNDRTPTAEEFLADLFPKKPPLGLANLFPKKLPLGLVGVMLLVIVAGFAAWEHFKPHDIPPPPIRTDACEQSTVTVNTLLKKAEKYMQENRFIFPPGENALEKSQQVLALCPDNEQAQAILGQMAEFYENKAKEKLKKGHIGACRDNIKNGLRAVPDHRGLVDLKARCPE
jgi:serine/threonine protein kinase